MTNFIDGRVNNTEGWWDFRSRVVPVTLGWKDVHEGEN